MIAAYVAGGLFFTIQFVQGVMLNTWTFNQTLMLYGLPMALWLTAGLMTVFRYFSYLDLRIRQEGWAVELRMRAEASKLQSDLMLS